MSRDKAQAALEELGFNALEAEVYLFLLSSPAVTAYKIGQAIGRPTANVYKAVEALARRGAALVEDGEQRVCSAVPISELARQLERSYRENLTRAEQSVAKLEAAPTDERVFRIESVERVFERCEAMLRNAEKIVVVDAFPAALERIRPWVLAACKRRVEVFVEAYVPVTIPGAEVTVVPSAEQSLEAWKSEQLNVVVDGREHLLALLNRELTELRQAFWSNSLYLSCIQHAGRLSEHTLIAMASAAEQGDTKEVLRLLKAHRFFRNSEVPGHRALMARFAPASPRSKRK